MLIVVNYKKLWDFKYGLFNYKFYYIRIGLNKEVNDIFVMIFNDKCFFKRYNYVIGFFVWDKMM